LPWGIWLWGELRHPTQLYSAAAAALIAFSLYRGQRQFLQTPGVLALTWLACTAFVSILLEPLRGDSIVIAAGLRMEQLTAWFVLAGALILIGRRLNVRGKSPAVSRIEDTARESE
jgi:prolipoprotein diacylglyceryltransferase